jgi:hypothetical protein
MKKMLILCIVFTAVSFVSGQNTSAVSEYVTPELMREIMLEKSYETGLNSRGISGLYLTSQSESIYMNGLFFGAHLSSVTEDYQTDDIGMQTLSLVGAYGLTDKFAGPFKNLEISAKIPIIVRDNPDYSVMGFGETLLSGKLMLLEEDPFRPSVPSLSFIATLILPTAKKEIREVDTVGGEAGVVLGKSFDESSGITNFKVYLELLGRYTSLEDDQDLHAKMNLGLAFPRGGLANSYMNIEYGIKVNSDNQTDGSIVVVGVRYQKKEFNFSGGLTFSEYDDLERDDRSIYLTYEMKF